MERDEGTNKWGASLRAVPKDEKVGSKDCSHRGSATEEFQGNQYRIKAEREDREVK